MPVRRIGLVVHQGRETARDAAAAVHAWSVAHGVRCTEIDVWAKDHHRRAGREEAEAAGNPDLVVTLGGDGTFLRGARIAVKSGAEVLGVDSARSASSPRSRPVTSTRPSTPSTRSGRS